MKLLKLKTLLQENGPIAEIRKDLVYQLRIFDQTCFIDKVVFL